MFQKMVTSIELIWKINIFECQQTINSPGQSLPQKKEFNFVIIIIISCYRKRFRSAHLRDATYNPQSI